MRKAKLKLALQFMRNSEADLRDEPIRATKHFSVYQARIQ